jgi:hypothetical protein
LGPGRVHLRKGRIIFDRADDLALAVGRWRVTQVAMNGHAGVYEMLILPPPK